MKKILIGISASVFIAVLVMLAINLNGTSHKSGEDANISSNALTQKQKTAYERLAGVVDYVPESVAMTSHVDGDATNDMQKWWNYYRHLLPAEFVVVQDLPENIDIRSLTYASFIPQIENAQTMYPFAYMLVISVPVDQYDKAREYFTNDNTEYTFHHYVDTMGKGAKDSAYLIITENFTINEIQAIIAGQGGATLSDTAYDNKFSIGQDGAPSLYVDIQNYVSRLSSYRPEQEEVTLEALHLLTGVTEDASWLGSTSDGGKTWQGNFVQGELENNRMNPALGIEKIATTFKMDLDENGNATGYDYGISELVNGGISVATKGVDEPLGFVMNYMDFDTNITAELRDGVDTQVVIGPQAIKNIYQGAYTTRPLKAVTLDITGKNMEISFQFHTAEHAGLDTPIPEVVYDK